MAQRPLRRKERMMAVCSFIGYEEIFDADIESRLQLVVDQIVAHHECVEFLIHPRGKFYYICLLAALRAKMRCPQKVTVALVVLKGGEYISVPNCAIDKTVELHFDSPKKNVTSLLHKKLLQWLARKSTHLITCVYDQLYDPDNRLPQKLLTSEIISVTAPETEAAILDAVPLLKEREQIAFQKIQEGHSLKETGLALGVSPERARQLLDLGSRAIRKRLQRRCRQALALEQRQGKRTCGLFALGEATHESLDRFKSVIDFLVSTYDVGGIYVEQAYMQSGFITALHTFYEKLPITAMTSGKSLTGDENDLMSLLCPPCCTVGCVNWADSESMADGFDVIADMIERTDFCICDLSAALNADKVKRYAAQTKRTILLDIGKTNAGNDG